MMTKPNWSATFATSRRRNASSSRASPASTWTLVATSSCACSISRIACPPVDQLAASNSAFGVSMATSSVRLSARKYSSSMPKEYSMISPRPAAERITRCLRSSLTPRRSRFKSSESNAMVRAPRIEWDTVAKEAKLVARDNPLAAREFRRLKGGNRQVQGNYFDGFGRTGHQDVAVGDFGPVVFLVERLRYDHHLAGAFAEIQRVGRIILGVAESVEIAAIGNG